MRVVETKEALTAEVSRVCRTYYLQVWNEALNQAGIKASSTLKRAENVYYPPAIRSSSSSDPKADTVSKEADDDKDNLVKVLPSSNSPPKEAEQAKAAEKEKDITKRVVLEATKPLAVPKDLSKGKEAFQNLEIFLATLPIPDKEDPKGKGPASIIAKTAKSIKATGKDNPPLKIQGTRYDQGSV